MTNLEWFKKRINEISAEELGKTWETEEAPWCDRNCGDTEDACIRCVERWATKPHEKPMPNLEVGMMVHVKYTDGEVAGLGIVRTWNNNLIVTYEDGGFDPVDDEDVIIDAIYKAPSFGYVDSTKLAIWSRD